MITRPTGTLSAHHSGKISPDRTNRTPTVFSIATYLFSMSFYGCADAQLKETWLGKWNICQIVNICLTLNVCLFMQGCISVLSITTMGCICCTVHTFLVHKHPTSTWLLCLGKAFCFKRWTEWFHVEAKTFQDILRRLVHWASSGFWVKMWARVRGLPFVSSFNVEK